MTVYELIQALAEFRPDTEVCVSQMPGGFVCDLKYWEFEDGVVKLYGDGTVDPIEGR